MKNFSVFLLGLFSSLALGILAAGWFFFLSPEVAKAPMPGAVPMPAAESLNQAPAPTPQADGSTPANISPRVLKQMATLDPRPPKEGLSLEGELLLPPLLKSVLEGKADAVLSVWGFLNFQNGKNILLGANEISKLEFPYRYRFALDPAQITGMPNIESFRFVVLATLCFDRDKNPCGEGSLPRIFGKVDFLARAPGGIKEAKEIKAPPVVFNSYFSKPDAASCTKSGSVVSGFIQPTAKFLATHTAGASYLLVGRPFLSDRLPFPYGESPAPARPLSRLEMDRLEDFGIVSVEFSLKTLPARFQLKIPDRHSRSIYRLVAVECKESETHEACLARAFPLDRIHLTRTNRIGPSLANTPTLFSVVPQGFELPSCGFTNKNFYLHAFQEEAPFALPGAEQSANPPEVIEGVEY